MKRNTSLALLLLAVAFAGCHTQRYIYSPAPPNNPLFSKKGDSKLAVYSSGGDVGSSSSGGTNRGFDLQGGFAPGQKWALIASYSQRKEKSIYGSDTYNFFDSSVINYKRKLAEFGGGVFLPLDPAKVYFFTMYAGYGFGKYSFHDNGIDANRTVYSRYHSSHISKWFLQPSFNFFPTDFFALYLSSRVSFVRYRDIQSDYTLPEIQYYELDRLPGKTFAFFEPTFGMQFGIPDIKWARMAASITCVTRDQDESRLRSRTANFSIGVNFNLSAIKK